jgi:small-conductance mechanosensitive channel
MLLQFLPTELFIYRIFLLFIALAETAILTLFVRRYNSHSLNTGSLKKLFFYFIFLHLLLAVIGFFSNIVGKVILSEITVFAVFFNIFNGLVLIIVAILINGLVSTGIDSENGQQLHIFQEYGRQIKQKTIYLVNTIAIAFWVLLILKNFRILNPFYDGLKYVFTYKISIGSASFSIDGFLIFFAVIYAFNFISKILRIVLEKDVLSRFQFSKGLPHSIAMVVRYILLTAGFFLAVNAAGIPVDKFTIILGAMSVGIGFGLQNIFNNLVSGLILLFERPIQLGDTVQVGQLTGNVQSIGLRSSNIKTFEGAEVIVPNGQLVSNEVINWTLSDQKRRIELMIQVAYHSDPELVYQVLSEILLHHDDVVQDPKSEVFFSELGESSLNFTLLFWIGDYVQGRRIKSEILFQVFKVLKENKIEIPFPQRDIHIRTTNLEVPGITSMNDKNT